ncbi:hypothetical protein EST38_g10575 [Candolleomyces aberdarensis]|uniref:Uncharacterized protein n=1 Tax=Candolleomyces aberdarensis TaxID=2316362 RepID=A0A4Q2D993_9AGAR|nr:hypothetical protein EST38_g10575 [Candolleomyces aberdarensis]
MIPRGCNALLVGDSITFGGTSTSKNPSTAVKHNILEVNGLIASYIVMHYRNALSSQSKFSITDGLFELDDFYRNCCKLLVDDDPLAEHILQKINRVRDGNAIPARCAMCRLKTQSPYFEHNSSRPKVVRISNLPLNHLELNNLVRQSLPPVSSSSQHELTATSPRTHRVPTVTHLSIHQVELALTVPTLPAHRFLALIKQTCQEDRSISYGDNQAKSLVIDDTSDDEYVIGPNPRRSAQTSQTLRRVASPEPPLHDNEDDDEDLSQPAPISPTLRRTVSREPASHDDDDDDMYGDDPEAGEYLETSRTGHRKQQDLGSDGEDFQSDDDKEDTTPTLPPNLQKIMYVALSLLESGSVSKAEKFFETAINLCQDPDLLAMMLEIWTTKQVTLTRKASIVSPSPERTLQTTPRRTLKHLSLIPAAFTPRPPSTPWNNLPAGSATPQPPPIPPTPHTPTQDLTQAQKRSSNTLDGRNDQEAAPTNTVKRRRLPKASAPATRV